MQPYVTHDFIGRSCASIEVCPSPSRKHVLLESVLDKFLADTLCMFHLVEQGFRHGMFCFGHGDQFYKTTEGRQAAECWIDVQA